MADPLGKAIRFAARYPGTLLAKTGITPNQVTVLGFFANCAVAYAIAASNLSYLSLGTLIWAAGFFDALDGSVAKITGRVTVFGDFFDSVMDRFSDSVIYIGIIARGAASGEIAIVVLSAAAMIGSFGVSYARAKAESLDLTCEVGLMPRTARIILLGLSFCLGQVFWGVLMIAVLSNVTVLQRIFYVRKHLLK